MATYRVLEGVEWCLVHDDIWYEGEGCCRSAHHFEADCRAHTLMVIVNAQPPRSGNPQPAAELVSTPPVASTPTEEGR